MILRNIKGLSCYLRKIKVLLFIFLGFTIVAQDSATTIEIKDGDLYAGKSLPFDLPITLKIVYDEFIGVEAIGLVDIDKNQALAKKLDVMSVPTFILYQKGEILWQRSGGMTKAKLTKYISKYLAKVE